VLLATMVTLAVYFIPHSVSGSEYDYTRGTGHGTAGWVNSARRSRRAEFKVLSPSDSIDLVHEGMRATSPTAAVLRG
jgi:hypothetical protein